MSLAIRPARDDDAEDFVRIVSGCWAEYPGCVIDIDGETPELRTLASHVAAKRGAAWVAEVDGDVAGVMACWPTGGDLWEIGKMYVAARYRGAGAAPCLLATAEGYAREHGATDLVLWSDTRFDRAHAFYEKHSFVRAGPLRALGDRSHSIEFGYAKPLSGTVVRVLDVAAAGAAVGRLADILVACVDDGAAVSFLPPLSRETAGAFWRAAATDVATGRRIVLAAWLDGVLSGTVTLGIDTPPNQPHRADLQKLLVHPAARRRGVARALMAAAHDAARAAGRTLLTLDTRAGDVAEMLYRGLGYTEAGRIPDYALNPDGAMHATVVFWRYTGLSQYGRIAAAPGQRSPCHGGTHRGGARPDTAASEVGSVLPERDFRS